MACAYCGKETYKTTCDDCLKLMTDRIRMNKAPCRSECKARVVGCHSVCAFYIEFKEFHEYVNEQEHIQNELFYYKSAAHQRESDYWAKHWRPHNKVPRD